MGRRLEDLNLKDELLPGAGEDLSALPEPDSKWDPINEWLEDRCTNAGPNGVMEGLSVPRSFERH